MQEYDINNGNKLMIEILGHKPNKGGLYELDHSEFKSINVIQTYKEDEDLLIIEAGTVRTLFHPRQMNFHNDWNWLMKVVERICSLQDEEDEYLYTVEIRPDRCSVYSHMTSDVIENEHGEDHLTMVFHTLVEFIEYYNNLNNH